VSLSRMAGRSSTLPSACALIWFFFCVGCCDREPHRGQIKQFLRRVDVVTEFAKTSLAKSNLLLRVQEIQLERLPAELSPKMARCLIRESCFILEMEVYLDAPTCCFVFCYSSDYMLRHLEAIQRDGFFIRRLEAVDANWYYLEYDIRAFGSAK